MTKTKNQPSANGDAEIEFQYGANRLPEDSPAADAAPDYFDIKALRLADVDPTAAGVTELLTHVRYGAPPKDSFFRVNPDPDYSATIGIVQLTGRDEIYYAPPGLWAALATEKTFGRRLVHTCLTVQGELFLWGCRLPGVDGKQPPWVTVPLEAAREAKTKWVRLFWDDSIRKHRILVATAQRDEPTWPDKSLSELLRLAFADSLIDSVDHPVLKKLRGEI